MSENISSLSVYCLYSFAISHTENLVIYPTELWNGKIYKDAQTKIKNELVKLGLSPTKIILSDEIITMDKNEIVANDYHFVFNFRNI